MGGANHLIQLHLKGIVVNKVPMLLAEHSCETTHAIQVSYPFNNVHSLSILWVTNYFDGYVPSIQEYEYEDDQKWYLIME